MTTHTAEQEQITPLPWTVEDNTEFGYAAEFSKKAIVDQRGFHLAVVISDHIPEAKENAAYLVKCANSFPALLAALEDDADYFYGKMLAAQETHDTEDFAEYTDRFNRASAAIAAAKAP